MTDEIYCTLSGQVPPEEILDFQDAEDDVPVGWTKISLTTKTLNPQWELLHDLMNSETDSSFMVLQQNINAQKEQLSEEDLEGYDEPDWEEMKDVINLQVKAKYGAVLYNLDQYIFDESVSYISDDNSKEITDTLTELKKKFDL